MGIPKNEPQKFKLFKCPSCGEPINTETWAIKRLKWVSTSVWWKPLTWGTGYYMDVDK